MKKIYILAVALVAFAFTGTSQEEQEDTFEFYNLGDISAQASQWRTWSGNEGGAEDADVVDTFASEGDQSMMVDGSVVTDMILLVDSFPNSGIYSMQWKMYIPAGKSGYFNMQADQVASGDAWAQALMGGNVYFSCNGGDPGVGLVSGGTDCTIAPEDAVFAFPHDEWFLVTALYDLDAETWGMNINGVEQFTDYAFDFGGQIFNGLGGIDFFSAHNSNEYYIDEVVLYNGDITLSSESFETSGFVSAISNGILTLKANETIDSVSIFNMLGQQVYNASIGSLSTTINMSSFASGTYIIRASVNGNLGTVKIVK